SGSVVVFDYEETENDMLDLYEHVGVVNTDRVRVESLRGQGYSLAVPEHRAWTVDYLRAADTALWVIDTHGRAMRGFGEENSNDDVRAFLHAVDVVMAEAGVRGCLLVTHTGRGEQAVGAERARGATVIDDDPDARWILTKD